MTDGQQDRCPAWCVTANCDGSHASRRIRLTGFGPDDWKIELALVVQHEMSCVAVVSHDEDGTTSLYLNGAEARRLADLLSELAGRADGRKRDPPQRQPSMPREWLSARELAEWLGVEVSALYRWNADGSGPRRYQVGRSSRYRLRDVETWLRTRAVEETEPPRYGVTRKRRT